MFETTTSIPAQTIQARAAARQPVSGHASAFVPGSRGAALGGNYVAAFSQSTSVPPRRNGSRPSLPSGHGYTARFDGAAHRVSAAAVDSYTAAFGSAAGAASRSQHPASGGRGSYTDANL
ncbi:hypothetical protein ITX31_13105 [Arthrobacter gandavensis]|uniref:hypothetical protein n=1 Tax=Arthrobacter gandavensis TaxID=169960 RepID=UPI00188EBE9D|nr:hypothetical protein [Arthrobacter gandavensis]MBF4995041.1 hypothetical protein [Arthrobacter gandavensis]